MAWGLDITRRACRGSELTLTALILLGACCPGLAQSPADAAPFSLSPQALYAAASAPKTPEGTDVSVAEVQETYTFEADGSSHYTQYSVYKILSAEGAEGWWSALTIYWSPWSDEKPSMRARVVAPDGTAYTLDPATIADSPAHTLSASLYSDRRVLRAPLPAITPGAVVETEIVLKERLPFAGAGKSGRSMLQITSPIQHFRLTLQAPGSLPLRHRVDAAPGLKPIRTTENGIERWVFDWGPVPAEEDEETDLPSDVYVRPMISFSTSASWQEVAQAYDRIIAEKLATANVADLTARLTKGLTTRETKAAALVAYMNREIRYTGIEFDQASVIPHTTAETLGRKYGDCKDKALLLVAMLRAAGIPAHLALLNVSNRLDVSQDLPGFGLFDHAIVHIPGEPSLWIDATAESARLGQVPDQDRGRLALIVDAQTTALTRIDEARSVDNVIEETREIRLANYGPAAVTETSTPSGNYEMSYRSLYADIKDKSTIESLTDYVKGQYSAERLEKLDRSDPKDFDTPFRLTLEGSKARRGYTSLSDALVYIPIEGLFESLPADLRTREPSAEEIAKATRPIRKRVSDYLLVRPFVAEWHYRIVPPHGFQPAALPAASTQSLGPAKFTEQFSVEPDGAVRADLRFDTVKRRFTPAEQSEMRNQVAMLLNREPIPIKFDLKAHALLTQGQPQQSFQAYRDLVTRNPKDAIQHLRRANALIEAGMGEAARAAVAAAIKLDPKSALARQTQAIILQYDLIGRWHYPGGDYAGAAAAYRSAIALDPDDRALVAEYAVLLEHDPRGNRYGSDAKLKDAIAEYRKLTREQLAEFGLSQNLAFALFYSRAFSESLQAANGLDAPPLALVIACKAQLDGVPQALEEAGRRTSGTAQRNETVSEAGALLMQVREYPNAAALLEAGANGANTAQTMGLVSLLRQAKRHEDTQFADSPEGLVRRGVVDAVLGRPTEVLDSYRSRNARLEWARLTPEERDISQQATQAMVAAGSRTGVPLDVLLDVALQGIQMKVSGDDTLGYRVVLQAPGMAVQTHFVVKEAGQYKMLANSAWPIPLATEVLERLERQDLIGAATLLAWQREAQPNQATEDPYSISPFQRLWPAGQRQGDARAITLAAAALLAQASQGAQRAVTLLEQAKSAQPSDAETENIDFALLTGYEQLRSRERALEIAAALAKRSPRSRRAFYAQAIQLRALNRAEEADALANQRLLAMPDDIDALRTLAQNAAARLDYAAAYERGLKVLANAGSGSYDLNQIAWVSLFYERPGGPDVDTAMRATQLRNNPTSALHTLGCAYAEVGKTREAREVLLQSMEGRNMAEPNGDFWYAFGRIAEQYGERDIALANYAKVKPPTDSSMEYDSSYRLAQNRVRALAARGTRN
jgi:transglutaminase-like putative cysteine protease